MRPKKESEPNDRVSSETGVPPAASATMDSSHLPPNPGWRQGGHWAGRDRWAAHPVLFGCLFVLQGYAALQPMGRVTYLLFYLAAVAGAIFLLQLALMYFVRQPRKPVVLASLCVLFFCFFGDARMDLGSWLSRWGLSWLARAQWMLPAAGAVFLALYVWVLRTPRTLATIRRYLDFVASLLIAVTLAGIGWAPSRPVLPPGALASTPLALGAHPPDIYYILTDANTSPESLQAYWGYDDSAFVKYMEGLGFHVLKNAHGNATLTPICLATYLNMNYPAAPPPDWPLNAQVAYYCAIISQAEAPARLKASGYDMRALSIFDFAGEPRLYTVPRISDPTLASVLWDRTVLGYLHGYYLHAITGEMNLKVFSLLPKIAAERSGQPKFVYAHLMMPHWPYLFDKQGRRIRRGMSPADDHPEDYLGQLIYENTLITNALAGILKNSETPPIIILQGDHGYRVLPEPHRSEEATTILNALYLPGSGESGLYPGLTPVNTFRLIFNRYFGQHYSYLPDVVPSRVSPFVGGLEDKEAR